ncbi:hypothetical protein [Leisingera methylohalidivorans]|uniref:hypothetical protein n=1 Tax=Leisingera methylohalidivorans TaxID=133924 RepID=UPI0012EBDDF3|nr:hypothetical protein [Leisingera methylohalidivorans]
MSDNRTKGFARSQNLDVSLPGYNDLLGMTDRNISIAISRAESIASFSHSMQTTGRAVSTEQQVAPNAFSKHPVLGPVVDFGVKTNSDINDLPANIAATIGVEQQAVQMQKNAYGWSSPLKVVHQLG